ncbi:MAG: cadmium-translocating P-type ATPase [Candidatus Eremiobacteraeota bacterium]|nr:cadmium-translocating P-type ATPase [Candidatus Eremiobacteraeota bacterium]
MTFERTDLAVGGMTCASCVNHVTRALQKVPGVGQASVNLATERASIEHAPTTNSADLIAAIERAGYAARVVRDESGDEDEHRIAREFTQKRALAILAVALFIPTFVLGMFVGDFPGKDWLQFALTLPVWAIVGSAFHRGALASLRHGTASMDTLVSLGSTAAFGCSIYATLAHQPAYYETASAIVTLVFIGKFLETLTRRRSNHALRALLGLRPHVALVRRDDGSVDKVSIDAIRAGDTIVVPAGERLPVDGIVLEGESAVDVSMLTGEPIPQDAVAGSSVAQGTLNGNGTLVVRAERVGTGTTLGRIVEIVKRAQGSTPEVQRLADRISGVFVPAILTVAALTFVGWLLTHHSWTHALVAAVAVLVVACPCALGLATPAAVIAAVGVAARHGILFRDADAIEHLAGVDIVAFDKTGTLTTGKPEVLDVRSVSGDNDERLVLAYAAALERDSTHPIGSAIVQHTQLQSVHVPQATQTRTLPGAGITGTIEGKTIAVGNARMMADAGVTVPPTDTTVAYVAADGHLIGEIYLGDRLRDDAAAVARALQSDGIAVAVVSGDNARAVREAAEATGAVQWRARMLPEEKADYVQSLQSNGKRVAFVGDGINDAPALAVANVGIAMGAGSEIALETAQVALLTDRLSAVETSIRLAGSGMRTLRQNLFWAFAYNVVLVPLAAFGIVHPIFAAAAMGASSLFVVGNALRLGRR